MKTKKRETSVNAVRTTSAIRVLLVEDSPTQAEFLSRLLEENGCEVSIAFNGTVALTMCEKVKPTIVLSDIVMPEMDGYELCRTIKNDPNLKTIPVILLTSLSDPADILAGLAAGASDYLVKPVDRTELRTRIERVLGPSSTKELGSQEKEVEVKVSGRTHQISANRSQVLDLLVSTAETAVRKNSELKRVSQELDILNHTLEDKVAEQTLELRRSEEKYRDLLENSHDLIQSVTPDGRFDFVNREWLETLGYSSSDLANLSFFDIVHPESLPATKCDFATLLLGGSMADSEAKIQTKSGEVLIVEVSASSRYHKEKLVSTFLYFRDITKRKLAELRLQWAYEDLEERVRQRTVELSDANLNLAGEVKQRRASEDALVRKNNELKSFSYTVSHDLKAPLRGIMGYAQELTRRHSAGLDERGIFCTEQVIAAVRNLDRLIEDLLRYARLEASKLEFVPINFDRIIKEILVEQHHLIEQAGVEIECEIPECLVDGWERGVNQLLSNVVGNAIKYSKGSKPPRVHIRVECLESTYRIMVKDNGIGFDMAHHDKLFDLFRRMVRADEFEGTGAGLAIVKKIVDRLGGKVWAESSPGNGATFFVELPSTPPKYL